MIRRRELLVGFILGVLVGVGLVVARVAVAKPNDGGLADDPDTIHCAWVCSW